MQKKGNLILKTGIDLVSLRHAEDVLSNNKTLEALFHKTELHNKKIESIAGTIALKEAFFKALNITPRWLDIEVMHPKRGKPSINWNPTTINNILSINSCVNHDGEYTVATVTIIMQK